MCEKYVRSRALFFEEAGAENWNPSPTKSDRADLMASSMSGRRHLIDQHISSCDYYAGYEEWKNWDKPFTFTAEEAEYFAGEFSRIPLAGMNLLEIGFG